MPRVECSNPVQGAICRRHSSRLLVHRRRRRAAVMSDDFSEGNEFVLQNLVSRPDLNGTAVFVLRRLEDRVCVELPSGEGIRVKPTNLCLVTPGRKQGNLIVGELEDDDDDSPIELPAVDPAALAVDPAATASNPEPVKEGSCSKTNDSTPTVIHCTGVVDSTLQTIATLGGAAVGWAESHLGQTKDEPTA